MARTGPTILLVRHGETEWSRSGRHTSDTDLPLTEPGRVVARGLSGRLPPADEPALVLASPLARARQTCELAGFGAAAELTDDLREVRYGAYEGLTTAQVRARRPGWDLWRDGTPDGEPLAAAGDRADRVIERARSAGGDVLVFGHGHMLRILGARWIGLPAAAGGSLGLGTASISELGFERERRVIWRWNA